MPTAMRYAIPAWSSLSFGSSWYRALPNSLRVHLAATQRGLGFHQNAQRRWALRHSLSRDEGGMNLHQSIVGLLIELQCSLGMADGICVALRCQRFPCVLQASF